MTFEISLENLSFYSYHGVLEHERQIGNEFKVWLTVETVFNEGIANDELSATVSYVELYRIISEEMMKPCNLLETLSWKIVKRITDNFAEIKKVKIKIEKVRPPIQDMLGNASVSLCWP